jgi:hypothetical protein
MVGTDDRMGGDTLDRDRAEQDRGSTAREAVVGTAVGPHGETLADSEVLLVREFIRV